MLLNVLRRASEKKEKKKKSIIRTFAKDLWKGWELNPDCLIAYAGPYAQDQPLF